MKLATYLEITNTSPEAFGNTIGTSRWAVCRYLRGERIPRSRVMKRILTATNAQVTPADFYDSPVPPKSGTDETGARASPTGVA